MRTPRIIPFCNLNHTHQDPLFNVHVIENSRFTLNHTHQDPLLNMQIIEMRELIIFYQPRRIIYARYHR